MNLHSIIDLLSGNLANAIAWTILHSLWQASLIALIMSFIIKNYATKKAAIRYKIALYALYTVLISAIITFFYYYQADHSLMISGNVLLSANGEQSSSLSASGQSMFIESISAFLNDNHRFIANTWLIGALFFSFKFVGGISFIQKLKNTRREISNSQLVSLFEEIKNKMGIEKNISFSESDKISTPMVMGVLKPIILVPVGIINQLDYSEVEAVLAHELAHIQRNDFLHNLVQSLVEIFFYYHPAVWWISANIRAERENCCDDMAVDACGNAIDYAKTLVKVQEWQLSQTPGLAIPLSRNRRSLFERINRILNQPQNKTQIREKMAATLLLCTALFAFANSPNYTAMENPEEIEIHEIMIDKNFPETDDQFIFELAAVEDSIPEKKETKEGIYFKKSVDNKDLELEIEDGEIKSLKIDGEQIPEDRYDEYKEEFEEYMDADGNKYFFLGDENNLGFYGKKSEENPFYFLKKLENLNWDSLIPGRLYPEFFLLNDSLKAVNPEHDLNKFYFFSDSLNVPFDEEELRKNFEKYQELFEDYSFEFDQDGNRFLWKGNPDFLWVVPEDHDSMIREHLRFYDLDNLEHRFDGEEWEDFSKKLREGQGFDFRDLPDNYDFKFFMPEGLKEYDYHFRSKSPGDVVINELWEDGLLVEGEENKIELSGKYLKINGEKQPKNIWKKYKKLYEEKAGHELTKKSKIELKVDGEKPKVFRRTIRI